MRRSRRPSGSSSSWCAPARAAPWCGSYCTPFRKRGAAARRAMADRYRPIGELWNSRLDGLIVTGTEPRSENMKDEPYWGTLGAVIDWAHHNTASTIWSCLAAHAAVLQTDGIERRA